MMEAPRNTPVAMGVLSCERGREGWREGGMEGWSEVDGQTQEFCLRVHDERTQEDTRGDGDLEV